MMLGNLAAESKLNNYLFEQPAVLLFRYRSLTVADSIYLLAIDLIYTLGLLILLFL